MKLYTGMGPNPNRVNILIAEKNIEIPTTVVNIMLGETRTPDFLKVNSLGELPVLETDDGEIITETMAVSGYLDEVFPGPSLMGTTPEKKAKIRMWSRRIEQQFMSPLGQFGLHVIPIFAEKIEQMPAYAESMLRMAAKNVQWLDAELSDGRTWVCDDEFSSADIVGMVTLFIYDMMNMEIDPSCSHVKRWEAAMRARPTFIAAPDMSDMM